MPPKRHPITGQVLKAEIASRAVGQRIEKEGPGVAGAILHAFTYVGLALLGLTFGALLGYMFGAGLLTLIYGGVGLALGLLVAVFATGHFRDAVESGHEAVLNATEPLVPSFAREAAYGHDAFSLLVTVHEVKTQADDILTLKMSNFDGYMVVKCGANPPKSTCVSEHCIFEETFKLHIRPRDAGIHFELRDQELLHDDFIGAVEIPISVIINTGFPVMKAFSLFDNKRNKVGNLMLSFDWCADFPSDRLLHLQQQLPAEFARRDLLRKQALQSQAQMKSQAVPYGTFVDQSRVFVPGRGQP